MPSLTRLSPSITDVTFRGTPRRRAIVVAASGSVGETMAPSANAAAHGRPAIAACATTATATVVRSTSAIALSVIGAQVRAQVAQRREVRRVEQQRRQEDEEDELRLELDVGHAGREADEAAADHEQDRVRHVEDARQRRQRRDRDQQEEDDELGVLHRAENATSRTPRRAGRPGCCVS